MFWVIDKNLYKERNYESLLNCVERLEIPHVVVKVVPDLGKIIPADFDTHSYFGYIDDIPDVEIDPNQLIMVCGGISLSKVAIKNGWKPGSFNNENFDYVKWRNSPAGDFLLNRNVFVNTFRNIGTPDQEFFIRPCEDTKAFSGIVMKPEEFDKWRGEVLSVENDFHGGLDGNTMVTIAALQKIYAEYRFFVVDGKIVTYSQYKLGDRVIHNADVDQRIIWFAAEMIQKWHPSRAFVIDVADTPDGLKIVEYNGLNSAGFYACDTSKIVAAIEAMRFHDDDVFSEFPGILL
jgi:hypothetical protein